jgi:hypothetical protein
MDIKAGKTRGVITNLGITVLGSFWRKDRRAQPDPVQHGKAKRLTWLRQLYSDRSLREGLGGRELVRMLF